ncbi:hypothetical protein [Actinacidiphila acididurans]|uniref:hypothetical protein n=1 Tax=Actinacidiphila acididurans TaxID=2784346 RepID=UPI001F45AF93|nr:hypothetical protein [Actinacidiphila acididurans]
MTRSSRTPRPLTVDDETFLWTLRHDHRAAAGGKGYEDCREVLTIRRTGALGRLLITFAHGPGHLVPDAHAPSGAVGTPEGTWLNLHEPGTVRALLEAAHDLGLGADSAAVYEVDGWTLFASAAARCARTPEDGGP